MRKIIKAGMYNKITKEFSDNIYTLEEDGKYPLNHDGSVHFTSKDDVDNISYKLEKPCYAGSYFTDDILEIDGKFGVYDWNMNLIGKLYDMIEDVPVVGYGDEGEE